MEFFIEQLCMILKRNMQHCAQEWYMKKQVLYILIVVCMVLSTACSMQKDDTKKVRDIDFTVVDSIDLPEDRKCVV